MNFIKRIPFCKQTFFIASRHFQHHLILIDQTLKKIINRNIHVLLNNDNNDIRDYTKCSYKTCDSCKKRFDEITYIVCNPTSRKYIMRTDFSCNSKNVICMTYSIKCMKQDLGSTAS